MGKGKGSGGGNGSGKGCGKGDGSGEDYKGKTERLAVPAMPAPAAVICCVLNFLIPGLGDSISISSRKSDAFLISRMDCEL